MYGELASVKGFIGAALWIEKPQLAPLIMATAGVAIVRSTAPVEKSGPLKGNGRQVKDHGRR